MNSLKKYTLKLSRRSNFFWKQNTNVCLKSFSTTPYYDALENSNEDLFDVLIVGGGIVGSSLALKLKNNPLMANKKIGIIEAREPGDLPSTPPDLRTYTISPASKKLFEECGVWQNISEDRIAKFKDMQIWDSRGDGYVRFDSNKINRTELAYVLENGVLQSVLYNKMKELSEVTENPLKLYCPSEVKLYRPAIEWSPVSEIILKDETKLATKLLIAADGNNSKLRNLSGLGTWGWDYDQKAVVATIKTESPNSIAFQRFLSTGPLAILPMRDGYSSIVWSCTTEMADELVNVSAEEFIKRLNNALHNPSKPEENDLFSLPVISDILKGVENAAKTIMSAAALTNGFVAPPIATEAFETRIAFPLKFNHAITYTKRGIALIGDSAHSIHPLAGQGLNLGLADVDALGNCVFEAIENGQDISNPFILEDYESKRKQANITMALAMDGFKRLFGPNPDVVALARNVGMGSLNAVEPLKVHIMRYAMGI